MVRGLIAAARRWHTETRVSALERQLRQDPGDVLSRRAAVALYCQQAAREQPIVGAGMRREYVERAQGHLEVILKRTTDINLLYDTISRAVGPKMFYELPEITAQYMRRIGLDKECMEEFDSKSEFEERATQYHLANAITILKASASGLRRQDGTLDDVGVRLRDAAQALFVEAITLEWRGQRPITWDCFDQTPAVHVRGLAHRPFWDGDVRPPLADVLEAHYQEISEDLDDLLERRRGAVPAYPALVASDGGVWDMLQLYVNRTWNQRSCKLAPRTTALLKKYLPSAGNVPYIHYNTEEIVLFLLEPGSSVRLHNGGSNVPINVGLGLRGCAGGFLEVAGETRHHRDGKVVCFDDGSDHRVWNQGTEERWVLTVRLMHPQMAEAPWKFFTPARAFTRRTEFESWDQRRAATLGSAASS